MQLTETTMQILKNYASINSNIVINEGNVIRTVSDAMNVLSSAELDVSFPVKFGIYDLSEFLNVIALVNSPDIQFSDDHVTIYDGSRVSSVKYYYSSIDILTSPKKEIIMPEPEIKFVLDRDTLNKIKRAASVLGHTQMCLVSESDNYCLKVIDSSDETSNVFSITVPKPFVNNDGLKNGKLIFNIANLKMIEGDYDVSISSKLISHFKNRDIPVQYWISLEKTSSYGD